MPVAQGELRLLELKSKGRSKTRGRKPGEDGDSLPGGKTQASGVQSLERAFSILEEVARAGEGIRLADLSKRVGLHNSTTFHLVRTMVSLGYIRQLPEDKSYRIGRPLFALAARALDETEMVSLGAPILEDLARSSGESSHFAVRSGDSVIVLARYSGPGAFQYVDRAGISRPAYATAIGKVLLAAMSADQFEDYLERMELKAFTDNTITSAEKLRSAIEEVRQTGVAYDDCELEPELRCVAVAVHDFSGRKIGAIGISGPMWRMTLQALNTHTATVRVAADRLSLEFGHGNAEAP